MAELRHIPLDDIDEPSLPARAAMDEGKLAELGSSMAQIGLLQPIIVFPVDTGRFEIEAGHRRYMCARHLGWKDIPALVFKPDELAQGAAMLAENVNREDLNAAEEALLFAQSAEKYALHEAGLVERFKKSADYIADRLRLLRDDPEVFNACLRREINFSVARELNKCDDEQQRRYFLHQAIAAGSSARVIAKWVSDFRALRQTPLSQTEAPAPAAQQPEVTVPAVACFLCGGHLDPYNLVAVYIHKHELEKIRKEMEQLAQVDS